MIIRSGVSVSLIVAFGLCTPVPAEDFRVETDVYFGDEREPVSQTLTIFSGEVIYDFVLGESEEITVFDARRGRMVLLDPSRKKKTTLSTEQLLEFTAAIKARALQGGKNQLVEPRLETSFDESTDELILASPALTYRVKTIAPKVGGAANQFRQFADWYARLNAARPGNIPPFARIELNKAMAIRNLIPDEIERTLKIERPLADKTIVSRSQHTTTWILSGTDRKRIDRASRYMAEFAAVTAAKYWQIAEVASR